MPVNSMGLEDWEYEETPDEGELIVIDFDYICRLCSYMVIFDDNSSYMGNYDNIDFDD